MDKLKLIKGVVFAITFMLILGTLTFLTVLYRRANPPATPHQDTSLAQPNGSEITSVTAVEGNLAILVKGGKQPDRIIIYNPQTMQKISTLHI